MQVFEYFDKEVTRANGYQVKEAYSVSQDLLAVLDGELTLLEPKTPETKNYRKKLSRRLGCSLIG